MTHDTRNGRNISDRIAQHYDKLAEKRDAFIEKNQYYYDLLVQYYSYMIPAGKRILEIGCGTGYLLNALQPCKGVGIDLSGQMILTAAKRYPNLEFHHGTLNGSNIAGPFDYVILSGTLHEEADIIALLKDISKVSTPQTRIIIEYYSYLWQVILKTGERLGLKMPQPLLNWLTHTDIKNFLHLCQIEPVRMERKVLFPVHFPVLSFLFNRVIANLPFLNALTLNHFIIARPLFDPAQEHSVSMIVPARNEKGNIEAAIQRTPVFGSRQEFIFIEGGSKDGTYEEIERVAAAYPQRNIRYFKQNGHGKGDAVRLGFSKATGDILMILDADLTVAPEDLPRFYDAIKENKGEFINGCRLVYPMEKEAMRFLNLVANKFFGILFSWLVGQKLKDTLCGTKVLFRTQYEEIARNRDYFGDFDPFGDFDLIFGASKLNLKITELPIRYKERTYGSTQIRRFYHGLLLFKMCWFACRKIKFI
ncbi:MAG TPA: glycosyltransferase [Candidatus Omnitrophota bacterium]|nr:glycosyltransferase [Candidatus Omnitrophota bacterium]